MSRMIPNENSWVAFSPTAPADIEAPTEAELEAATVLTKYVVSINPQSTGAAVPTPSLDSKFNRSITGTRDGSFTGDFYRDDEVDPLYSPPTVDLAWKLLALLVAGVVNKGYFFISRFGGTGTNHQPVAGEPVEVWPVAITSRVGSALTTNTVETFNVTAAVPEPPAEDAVVAASSGAPTAPLNLVATAGATGLVELDWDAPAYVGTGSITYAVYKSTVAGGGGSYTLVSSGVTVAGTTAALTGVTAGLTYFKVLAHNTAGDGPQSAFASCTVV